jgi:hypothetical protein
MKLKGSEGECTKIGRFSAERISYLQEPVNELFWRDKWMISMTRDGISVEIEGRNAHRDRSLAQDETRARSVRDLQSNCHPVKVAMRRRSFGPNNTCPT